MDFIKAFIVKFLGIQGHLIMNIKTKWVLLNDIKIFISKVLFIYSNFTKKCLDFVNSQSLTINSIQTSLATNINTINMKISSMDIVRHNVVVKLNSQNNFLSNQISYYAELHDDHNLNFYDQIAHMVIQLIKNLEQGTCFLQSAKDQIIVKETKFIRINKVTMHPNY